MRLARRAGAALRRSWLARGHRPEICLALFVGVNLAWMAQCESWYEIPYHLIFFSVTIAYGLRSWPTRPTLAVVGTLAAVIAILSVTAAPPGEDGLAELAGLPLIVLMFLAMVYHVERRRRAVEAADGLAAERAERLEQERYFFARASHELATPLTIARGHLEVVGRGGPPSAQDVEIAHGVVIEELRRMEDLVSELLLAARLAAGAIRRERVPVEDLIEAVAADWTALPCREWEVRLEAQGTIEVDSTAFMRGIDSLIENAYRHTGEADAIVLATSAVGDRLVLTVEDHGEGIPAEALPHIFERFYQARTKGSPRPRGAGLGLSIVKAMVEAHGGVVRVASRLGEGTRVEIELPGFVSSSRRQARTMRAPDPLASSG